MADITLLVNGEEIKAHKCILASRSPKFEGMFDSNLKEMDKEEIEIECKNPHLLKLMVTWMYCGDIKFPDDVFEVFDLMLLADEYLISDLK